MRHFPVFPELWGTLYSALTMELIALHLEALHLERYLRVAEKSIKPVT